MHFATNASLRLRTLVAVATLAVTSLHAQQTTTLHGTILDPLGAVVPAATIELLASGTPTSKTTSAPDGSYTLPLQHPGLYAIRATAPGFAATTSPAQFISGQGLLNLTLATPTLTQQVTVTANGTPTPEAQTGVTVTVLTREDFPLQPEVQDPLRLVTGLQIDQSGQLGGTTALRIRGGDSDSNRVLLDGSPVSQIGGLTEFANLAATGVSSIEILHEPNSALFGSDAMSGVVTITSTRATPAPLPILTYAGDAGNFRTYRNEVTASETYRHLDLYSALSRMDTRNSLPNSKLHNFTYAGNFGYQADPNSDLRLTFRRVVNSAGQPNAIYLYGIADSGQQKEQDYYATAIFNHQTTPRWHNQLRYSGQNLNAQSNSFGPTGISDSAPQYASTYSYQNGYYNGKQVTITGANGYSTTGTAIFQYSSSPSSYLAHTGRELFGIQSDYRLTPHLVAFAAFQNESESGSSGSLTATRPINHHTNDSYTLQLSGDVLHRIFFNLGSGLEQNGFFGFAATPRTSVAAYLFRPSTTGIFTGTKLHGSFGKGIKEASIYIQQNSLHILLPTVPSLGPEYSRTFDAGLDQQFLNSRLRTNLTWFHNQYTNKIEYVPSQAFASLGLPASATTLYPYGAYVNSGAFRSLGLEFESEYRLTAHLFTRAGYTYTDARVQQSFNSDNYVYTPYGYGPSFNTSSNFSSTPIGAYSPLKGARPFRVAPHTGYFALAYTQPRLFTTLTGSLVSKRDDSTYLGGSDVNYGNSLLLPNRNLLGSYERLDLATGYNLTHRITLNASIQNLLSQHYFESYGYPSLPLTFRAGFKINLGGESFHLN